MPMRTSVFVVDDDLSMRAGIMRLLRAYGFSSTLFDSADAILRHDNFGQALCVILDIDLTGESGVAVSRRLADKGIRLPVIFITGKDSETACAATAELGCVAYLTKPFSAASLIEPIERMRATAA